MPFSTEQYLFFMKAVRLPNCVKIRSLGFCGAGFKSGAGKTGPLSPGFKTTATPIQFVHHSTSTHGFNHIRHQPDLFSHPTWRNLMNQPKFTPA